MYECDSSSGTFFTEERKESLRTKTEQLLDDANHDVRILSLSNLAYVGDATIISALDTIIAEDPYAESGWFPVRERAKGAKRSILRRLQE